MKLPAAALRILAYVAAGALALWLVGQTSGRASAERKLTEMHERNATVALRDLRKQRLRTDTVIVTVVTQGRTLDAAIDSARDAIADAHEVLADSQNSPKLPITDPLATILRLRASLATLTVRAETLVAEAVVYRTKVNELTLAVAMERARVDSVIGAKDLVIRSLKAERCALNLLVATVPCPTRTQVFIGGLLIGGATVAAAGR